MTNKPREFMPHESDNSYIAVEYRKLKAENDALKAQVEELKQILDNREVTSTDFFEQLKTSRKLKFENEALKAQLEIAVKALEFYEYPWTEYQYKNFFKDQGDRARQALAQIQKMRGVCNLSQTTDEITKRRDEMADQISTTQVSEWECGCGCAISFKKGFDAGVAEMQAQVEFLKMYYNPADTSFKTMIETFSQLSDEQKQALINLTEALLKTKEAK